MRTYHAPVKENTLSRAAAHNIQKKLTVSHPGDQLEREADKTADQIALKLQPGAISSIHSMVQRKCGKYESSNENDKPLLEKEYPLQQSLSVLRKRESEIRPQNDDVSASLSDRIAGEVTGGEFFPHEILDRMETAFGYDFSHVHVHRDSKAEEFSRQLNARAFTVGDHIYFGAGAFDPGSSAGDHLIAHELTHVIQQGKASRHKAEVSDSRSGGNPFHSLNESKVSVPAIQRSAEWIEGNVNETNNLASAYLTGDPLGTSYPMLNGSTFWSQEEVRKLINPPTLSFTPAESGGFDASVDSLPENTGSFDETVPIPGPWMILAPRSSIIAEYPELTMCSEEGESTFQVIGNPSDEALYEFTKKHERRHSTDHQEAFNDSIVSWDEKLAIAQSSGRKFNGETQEKAEAMLYAMMRGTPKQIAERYLSGCISGVGTFHSTPEGGPATSEDPVTDENCSTVTVETSFPTG